MSLDESSELAEPADVAAARGRHGGRRPGAGRKPELADPVRFTVDIEADDFSGLEAVASQRGVSRGAIVREAIRAYVARKRR
jgi:hypothetical protein